jgi:hypothetical protein
MADSFKIMGKISANIWMFAIFGSILIIIESLINIWNTAEAWLSIGISLIVIISSILSRKEIHMTGITIIICSYFLLLSPIGFSGFLLGTVLILIGGLFTVSGGMLFVIGNFFIYVAIGAVVIDLVMLLV